MPKPHPEEFRRRAVELARLREKPIAQIAADLGISESCLRRWMARADVDEGRREGVTSDERAELVRLRRANRQLEMENEILKRAAALEWPSHREPSGMAYIFFGDRCPSGCFRELTTGTPLPANDCRFDRGAGSHYVLGILAAYRVTIL